MLSSFIYFSQLSICPYKANLTHLSIYKPGDTYQTHLQLFDSSTIWKEYIQNIYSVQSVKCSAHLSNYSFLSLIISPTHLALWLNRVELTGNFPFLEWCLIQAVSSNEQPFSSAHCCTWQIRRFLAIAAGQGHQCRQTKDRGLSNPRAFALAGIMP